MGLGTRLEVGARYEKGRVGSPLQVRYKKSGGGGQFASGPLRKVGGGGRGGGQFASGPLQKVGKGGGGGGAALGTITLLLYWLY